MPYIALHMVKDLMSIAYKPLNQWLIFLGLAIILIFIILRPKQEDSVWVIAAVTYLAFIFINSVLIWTAESTWSYFFYSLLFSVLYLVVVNFLVQLYSQQANTEGSGESSMIFLVIIYHPFLLLLMIFIKWIYLRFF